jgi:hypothetical protein
MRFRVFKDAPVTLKICLYIWLTSITLPLTFFFVVNCKRLSLFLYFGFALLYVPHVFFKPMPSPCIMYTLSRNNNNGESDRPNYKRANVIEMDLNTRHEISHSTRDTELHLPPYLCYGGKTTAHLKAIYHSTPNLLYMFRLSSGRGTNTKENYLTCVMIIGFHKRISPLKLEIEIKY